MSDREHFIATLQACYFGDRNAFDEIVRIYDKKENIIKEVREIFKYYGNKEDIVGYANYTITGESLLELLEILDKVNNDNKNNK